MQNKRQTTKYTSVTSEWLLTDDDSQLEFLPKCYVHTVALLVTEVDVCKLHHYRSHAKYDTKLTKSTTFPSFMQIYLIDSFLSFYYLKITAIFARIPLMQFEKRETRDLATKPRYFAAAVAMQHRGGGDIWLGDEICGVGGGGQVRGVTLKRGHPWGSQVTSQSGVVTFPQGENNLTSDWGEGEEGLETSKSLVKPEPVCSNLPIAVVTSVFSKHIQHLISAISCETHDWIWN